MHRYGRAFKKKSLAAAIVVALVAGVAWAAESQTVSVPGGNAFTADTVIIPGTGGATFCGGDRTENEVDFSVDFGEDCLLRVNGEVVGPYTHEATYSVTVVGSKVGSAWQVDTTVVNEDTGTTTFVQSGYVMPGKPTTVTATALDVICLTCE